MSTRCQIGFYRQDNDDIKKPNVLLYRHCDGYPGTIDGKKYGVLTDIVPFLRRFYAERGDDIEYCAAWLMHHLIDVCIKSNKEYLTTIGDFSTSMPADGKNWLGYGISTGFHGDIEFYYGIKFPTLTVYSADCWKGTNFKPLRKIKLTQRS